jgi:hypothetical protein
MRRGVLGRVRRRRWVRGAVALPGGGAVAGDEVGGVGRARGDGWGRRRVVVVVVVGVGVGRGRRGLGCGGGRAGVRGRGGGVRGEVVVVGAGDDRGDEEEGRGGRRDGRGREGERPRQRLDHGSRERHGPAAASYDAVAEYRMLRVRECGLRRKWGGGAAAAPALFVFEREARGEAADKGLRAIAAARVPRAVGGFCGTRRAVARVLFRSSTHAIFFTPSFHKYTRLVS